MADETGEVNEFNVSLVSFTAEHYLLMPYRSAVENLCNIHMCLHCLHNTLKRVSSLKIINGNIFNLPAFC